MAQNLLAGLSIALTGLIITFTALGLFGVVIWGLGKIFKYKEPESEASDEEVTTEQPAIAVMEADTADDLPVVIATAVSYFLSQAQSSLGSSLEEGKSGWWAVNRMNASQGTGIRIKRSGQ